MPQLESRARSAPWPAPRTVHTRRILVVDDNEDAAVLLQHALTDLGHVVEIAYDGPSALNACRDFEPEIALLDIGLPVMDGFELAQRLRQLLVDSGRVPTLKLIAITGYGQDTDHQSSKRAGFHAHLVKPIDLTALARALEQPG